MGKRVHQGFLTLLMLLIAATGEAAMRRVLLLQSQERGAVALDSFTADLRVAVEAHATDEIAFSQIVVYPAGFGPLPEEAIVEFLRTAYAQRPMPDLVVTVGGPAAAFARKYHRELFPDTPMLFAAVDERFLGAASLADDETAVPVASDFVGVVEDILQLFPTTTTIFMVLGPGEIARFWREELETLFQPFRGRVTFRWSTGLSHGDMLRQVAMLPPNSAVYHIGIGADIEGSAYPEDRTLADIHAAANAPLFGFNTAHLGHGIIGGRLVPLDQLGRTAADIALKILSGASPGSIQTPTLKPAHSIFDWRELQRWNISESRLPAGSEIRFREQSIWDRFKWIILAGTSALVAQMVLIAALLVNRRRRRRAEESVRESEGRFRVLADSAPVLIRISDTQMRCLDVNRPWLDFTGRSHDEALGEGWLASVHPDDRAAYRQAATRALERREAFRHEYRLRRFDGEYRWLLKSAVPRFTPDGSFAGYISSAIDITELKAARAALSNLSGRLMEAQEQERTRVARELHDDVLQRMSFVAIDLVRVRDTLPATATDARRSIDSVSETVIALGRDVQGISHRLHSSKLGYLGLAAAADSFCRELSARHDVTIEFAHDQVPSKLPENVAISLMRVLQESLSNAAKHSGARECRVRLTGTDADVTLEVADDGVGFDPEAAMRGHGLGLISMRERLKLVDGDVTIESKPGAGTIVRASVPLATPVAVAR